MDISETTAPKSDQQSFEDFAGGITRIVTVTAVNRNNAEQPVNVELAEFPGRPYRPNLSMRRVLRDVWGKDTSAYIGRQLELRGNPDVMFGGQKVGGVEIKAMSHIDGPKTVSLIATKARRKPFTVQPLPADKKPTAPAASNISSEDLSMWIALFNEATTMADLGKAWDDAKVAGVTVHPQIVAAKDARKTELGA